MKFVINVSGRKRTISRKNIGNTLGRGFSMVVGNQNAKPPALLAGGLLYEILYVHPFSHP